MTTRQKRWTLTVLLFALLGVVLTTQFTVLVVQPIGAVPDGRTLIVSRLQNTRFIDSADAICERTSGGVNLLCRSAVLGAVMKNATVYARLPYSETLYLWSTGGVTYDR